MRIHHSNSRFQSGGYAGEPAPPGWIDSLPTAKRAFIFGAGPNGVPFHYKHYDGILIALNSTITIRPDFNIWVCIDQTAFRYKWIKTRTSAKRVFSAQLAKHVRGVDVVFNSDPTIHNVNDLTGGLLHGGATVAGCAIQLAYWLGCERTTLIGVDMYGDKHWDGSIGAPKHYGRVWSSVKQLKKVVRLVTARGMKVDTLSKTELSVPLVKLW